MVTAAGNMALLWVLFGASMYFALYTSFWLSGAYGLIWGIAVFVIWLSLTVYFHFSRYRRIFDESRDLVEGSRDDWILLVTILAAGFATGAALQNVSTINSQTVSYSRCITPGNLNVTSPNCTQIRTVSDVQGPFTYFGQVGVLIVVLAAIGALTFGIFYVLLRTRIARRVEADKTVIDKEPEVTPVQTSRDTILEQIDRVDDGFSQRKWGPMAYFWIVVLAVLGSLIYVTELTYQDLGGRFAIAAAGIAVVLSIGQMMLDEIGSWIATANYQRLRYGKEDLLLYALVLMKTDHPGIRLRDAQQLNPKLFEPERLVENLYR